MSVIYINNTKEYNKLRNNGFVIVDFNTTWCKPCKLYKPIFEKLADEHPGIKFLSVDAETIEHEDCDDIVGVPTFKFFLNGELKRKYSGIDQERMNKYIQRYNTQIYYNEKIIRKFTPEISQKVKNYLDGLGIKIQISGNKCSTFNSKIVEQILEYIDVFYVENE